MCIAIAHQHLNERNEWVWNCHGVIGIVFFWRAGDWGRLVAYSWGLDYGKVLVGGGCLNNGHPL
jgi:hypothetical protein